MQGDHDIKDSLQQDGRKRRSKVGYLIATALLALVLSVVFGSEAPRQVFAASSACSSAVMIANEGMDGQASKGPQECITAQYMKYLESLVSKIPLHSTVSSEEASKVPVQQDQQQTPEALLPAEPEPTATPIPPTPTPEPTQAPAATTPAQTSSTSVEGIINEVFGSYAAGAIQIAKCESGLNPNATNATSIGGSHAAGLFQILYPSTWNTTSQAGASPYDAYANTVAAHDIFVRDGYSWREWSCQP